MRPAPSIPPTALATSQLHKRHDMYDSEVLPSRCCSARSLRQAIPQNPYTAYALQFRICSVGARSFGPAPYHKATHYSVHPIRETRGSHRTRPARLSARCCSRNAVQIGGRGWQGRKLTPHLQPRTCSCKHRFWRSRSSWRRPSRKLQNGASAAAPAMRARRLAPPASSVPFRTSTT
jgi:hypothetical protein